MVGHNRGRPVIALFSGDTVIDRGYWGDSALMHVWGRFALTLIDERPESELYWFLIAKGYKTYRFLPVFFHEFDPHPARTTPDRARAVIDALARNKYPRDFDADRGVIRAGAGHDRLRSGVAEITAAGYTVEDTPSGPVLRPAVPAQPTQRWPRPSPSERCEAGSRRVPDPPNRVPQRTIGYPQDAPRPYRELARLAYVGAIPPTSPPH